MNVLRLVKIADGKDPANSIANCPPWLATLINQLVDSAIVAGIAAASAYLTHQVSSQ